MCCGNQDDLEHMSCPLSIFGIVGGPKIALLLALYIAGSPDAPPIQIKIMHNKNVIK